MDAQKREELKKRREALKDRQSRGEGEFVRGPIIPALREMDWPHEPAPFGIWTPAYLVTGANDVSWEYSSVAWAEQYRHPSYRNYPPLPGEAESDRARRGEQVAQMLWAVEEGEDLVTFGYHSQHTGVTLRVADALPVLETLLPDGEKVWIWSGRHDWLIESDSDGWTYLALPPERDPAQLAAKSAREDAYAAPFAQPVLAAGREITVWPRDHAETPNPARPLITSWDRREITLKALSDRGDVASLVDQVRPWFDERAPGETRILIDLRFEESPLIETTAEVVRDHFADLLALLERYDDSDPARPIHTPDIYVMSERFGWLLQLKTSGPYWRAEGAEPDASYRGPRGR